MRTFPYITLGKILDDLHKSGIKITRRTLLKIEKLAEETEGMIPHAKRTVGGWRVFTADEAKNLVTMVRDNYRIANPSEEQ